MGSLDKIIRLANRFARKLSLAQQGAPQVLEDPKAMVADAFFGAPASGKSEKEFMQYLNRADSKFQKAAANVSGAINIGATVNAKTKTADFLVANPSIKNALIADYTAFYGKSPTQQFQARLAAGSIHPPDIVASHPAIITF